MKLFHKSGIRDCGEIVLTIFHPSRSWWRWRTAPFGSAIYHGEQLSEFSFPVAPPLCSQLTTFRKRQPSVSEYQKSTQSGWYTRVQHRMNKWNAESEYVSQNGTFMRSDKAHDTFFLCVWLGQIRHRNEVVQSSGSWNTKELCFVPLPLSALRTNTELTIRGLVCRMEDTRIQSRRLHNGWAVIHGIKIFFRWSFRAVESVLLSTTMFLNTTAFGF